MTEVTVALCGRCGRQRDAGGDPTELLSWVVERERGRTQWMCPTCARIHVRDIEGKLPADYW